MNKQITFPKLTLLSLCLSSLLAACAAPSIGVVGTDTLAPLPNESLVVQGVMPSSYKVVFVKGKVSNGKFEQTKAVGVLVGSPSHGYLVGKVQAGDVIAMTLFLRPRDERRLRINFDFCGKDVLVFTVPKGKVIYLGDIAIEETGDYSFNVNYSSNINAAREHINANYPALNGALEQAPPQLMPYACPPTHEWHLIYRRR